MWLSSKFISRHTATQRWTWTLHTSNPPHCLFIRILSRVEKINRLGAKYLIPFTTDCGYRCPDLPFSLWIGLLLAPDSSRRWPILDDDYITTLRIDPNYLMPDGSVDDPSHLSARQKWALSPWIGACAFTGSQVTYSVVWKSSSNIVAENSYLVLVEWDLYSGSAAYGVGVVKCARTHLTESSEIPRPRF